MSDFDRFTEFLRREARGYNEAPPAPADAIWARVGARTGWEAAAERSMDGRPIDALGYNEAPPAPRERMWGRIEAAWGTAPGSRRSPRRWPRRHRVAGWAAALAAAASLVLGIALGRDAPPTQPGEVGVDPVFATVPAETAAPPPPGEQVPRPAPPAEPEPQVLAASALPVPGAPVDQPTLATSSVPEPRSAGTTEATPAPPARALPSRFATHRDREQLRFFGRAETLLTALRTDQRTPVTERDLAAWGRELLMETRMHLDLQQSRTPMGLVLIEDPGLLEDLELVMLQISRLGSGAPDVEWRLARESMDIKNALPRLRAVTDADGI